MIRIRAHPFEMHQLGVCLVGLLCCGLLVVGGMGCGGAEADERAVEVEWTLRPDPPHVGPTTLTLALVDSAGHPVTGADVSVEGNMAHAGMQPDFVEATERDSGRYTAPMEFTMAGDWFLLVNAVLPDGRAVEHTIEVPGVRPE